MVVLGCETSLVCGGTGESTMAMLEPLVVGVAVAALGLGLPTFISHRHPIRVLISSIGLTTWRYRIHPLSRPSTNWQVDVQLDVYGPGIPCAGV